ncbi:MAG TPA: radical SAM protein [Bacteroidia bacterium]|nr:radical SAM protein [Bacteroidia bacterium]
MRILLVYPEMPDTFYAMKHFMEVVDKKAAYPPLGLLTVASLLPGEWEKKLVDLNVNPLEDKELRWADYVFLSAMNVQENSVREIMARCKKARVKIVAGGSLFTHEYERFPGIEHFVLNEAEITLLPFLNDLKNGNPKHLYQSPDYANVETSPLPSFELVDMSKYLYAIVQYSRGCPYMCDFCDVTALFGRRPRTKTAEQIIAELEEINKNEDMQLILFADDNLIGNKKILKDELLPALIEWRKKKNPGFFFATQLTINLADDEKLMQLMIDAGFRHIFIGIETPSEETLHASHKNQNMKRDMLDNIHVLHQKGFIISAGFIVGFDSDDASIFNRQVNFIQQSGIPLPIVNILKAPPGTDLYKRIKSENRLSKPFAFAEGDTNIIPIMGEKELYNGFLHVIDNIYQPDKSFYRIKQFFLNYRFPKTSVKIRTRYNLKHLQMLLMIIYKLGIRDTNRKYFWKLIWWTFFYNRKFLDKSIFYGIMIYQVYQTYLNILSQVSVQLQQEAKREEAIAV